MLRQVAGAAAALAASHDARADDYPTRPVRLVIPYAAGASGDQIGRPWAKKMESVLGTIYVENAGGGGGVIGSLAVAQSAPDGYSLLLGNTSTHVLIPLTSNHLAYDPAHDFEPIYRLVTSALAIAVHPSLPVQNLQELVAYAKANPGRLSYGTPGTGTGNHLVGEMFKRHADAPDIVHLPYRGMAPAISDAIGGQIPMIISVVSAPLLEFNRTGKLRILAVTSEARLPGAPEIQTVIESGMPDLRYAGWFALFAPRATPRAIIDRIAAATRTALSDPALQESYRAQGLEPDVNSNPDQLQKLVEQELVRWGPVINAAGLKHD